LPPSKGGGITHYPPPPNVSNVHESRDMRKVLLEGRRDRPVLCTGLNRRRMRAPGGAHISSKKAVVPSANAPPSGRGSTDGLFYTVKLLIEYRSSSFSSLDFEIATDSGSSEGASEEIGASPGRA